MKKTLSFLCIVFCSTGLMAQYAFNSLISEHSHSDSKNEKHKTKPVMYNSLGYAFPLTTEKDIIIGGSSVGYKRWGFCLTYRLSIKNFSMPEGDRGDLSYDNVVVNKWTITPNTQRVSVFMFGGGFTIPITKRIPFYIGPGMTFYRDFFQYLDPFDNLKPKWNDNPNKSGLEMNYFAGVFIPIIGRILLNVEYDHNPQSVFVGIVIRDRFCYEDIDEW